MSLRTRITAAVLGFAAALGVAQAQAATITFDFTSGSLSASSYGNSKTFTSGTLSVTVSSWSFTGSGSTLQSAALGQYSGAGLGVCNRNEGTGCDSPQHQVDNNPSGAADLVLFVFNQVVDPNSISIDPYACSGSGCTPDRDVSYWMGTPGNTALSGLTATALNTLFGSSRVDDDNSSSFSPTTITLASGTGTAILFGAQLGNTDDFFKITGLSVNTTSVPEPMTLGLLGLGLAGLGAATRRRRTA